MTQTTSSHVTNLWRGWPNRHSGKAPSQPPPLSLPSDRRRQDNGRAMKSHPRATCAKLIPLHRPALSQRYVCLHSPDDAALNEKCPVAGVARADFF